MGAGAGGGHQLERVIPQPVGHRAWVGPFLGPVEPILSESVHLFNGCVTLLPDFNLSSRKGCRQSTTGGAPLPEAIARHVSQHTQCHSTCSLRVPASYSTHTRSSRVCAG